MASFPKKLHLPPPGRPRWVCPPEARLELLYLAWGTRHYHRHPIPMSRHDGWHYFVVNKGNPVFNLDGSNVDLKPNDFLIIHPDCACGWSARDATPVEILVWIWRSDPKFDELTPGADGWHRWSMDEGVLTELNKLHGECRREVEHPDRWSKSALEYLRMNLDVLLVRSQHVRPWKPPMELRFELAMRWLRQHASLRNPVAALCDYLQISPSSLNRMFQDQLGESPNGVHQQVKMELAWDMLSCEGISIKEVAYHLGYRHPNDFSRAFKSATGKTPSQFLSEKGAGGFQRFKATNPPGS